MLMAGQIVASVIIIGNLKPYQGVFKRNMETFNEVVLMFTMYTIICFSPLVQDPNVKFQIGYISMAVVSSHLAVNFGFIGHSTVRMIKLMLLLKMAKRKHTKQRAALQ